MRPLTIEVDIHFERRCRGSRRLLVAGNHPTDNRPAGRLPRITRLMALAIRFDQLIQAGEVADYAEVARLGHVTRARVTQIMNLLMLAPDIQEAILFLPRVFEGRDPIHLRLLQPIAILPDWKKQRQLWREIAPSSAIGASLIAVTLRPGKDAKPCNCAPGNSTNVPERSHGPHSPRTTLAHERMAEGR